MMNRTLKTNLVLMPVVLMSAMFVAILAGVTINQEASGQTANATSAANQTGPSIGNITSGDFSTVWDNLETARNAIIDNDTYSAFFALNDADNDLYGVVGETILQQQITPVRDQINNAQDAMLSQDLAKALQDVNSATVELTKVTQKLPSGEEETE
jgi:hypothetical protein